MLAAAHSMLNTLSDTGKAARQNKTDAANKLLQEGGINKPTDVFAMPTSIEKATLKQMLLK